MAVESDRVGLTVTVTSTNLLEKIKNAENRTVWMQFVDRYRPLILGYAQRRFGLSHEDAEEAAQASLLAFAEAYREGRYDRDKGRLRKWLFGIATRQIRNVVRKRAQRREIQAAGESTGTGMIGQIPDGEAALEQVWEAEWRHAVYQQCMVEVCAHFDARTIDAFELFARQGLAAQAVADKLGMTRNAVFLAKHKILKRIRELIPLMEESW